MSDNKSVPRRRGGGKGSKSSSAKAKSEPKPGEGHVCSEPGCGKVCKSSAGLASHVRQAHPEPAAPETPSAAVERVLATLTLSAKQAVLVATIRELASTLEVCEATDKTKTAKELTALMHQLLAGESAPAGPSWADEE